MKVGIISINMYSKGLNFACPLHTYAFQQFLLQNNIDATVIDYKPIYYDNFNLKYPADYYKELYNKTQNTIPETEEAVKNKESKLKHYSTKMHAWESMRAERALRYDKLQNFIDNKYLKTDFCYDSDYLEVKDPGFDCYICATDVLWKNQPDYGYDRGFFLGSTCMEQKWKIAYSGSRGVYGTVKEEFFRYLEDFDAISVREKSLQEYIEENSPLQATRVLDPVLLHSPDFYENILIKPSEEHYILLYYVMEKANDTIKHAVAYAKKYNLKIIEITDHPIPNGKLSKYNGIDYTFRYDIGIEEWIGYIKYADCIFTNSFHGCCLSILFEKNFYVGIRKGDKVPNLLHLFGLESRMLLPQQDRRLRTRVKNKLVRYAEKYFPEFAARRNAIDYAPVRKTLHEMQTFSADFILSTLHEFENTERPYKDYTAYKKTLSYRILYNSKFKNMPFTWTYDEQSGTVRHLTSGSYEYQPAALLCLNNGTTQLAKNEFILEGYHFIGWNIRLRIDNRYFWYTETGALVEKTDYDQAKDGPCYLFKEQETLPFFNVNRIQTIVAEAIWEKNI